MKRTKRPKKKEEVVMDADSEDAERSVISAEGLRDDGEEDSDQEAGDLGNESEDGGDEMDEGDAFEEPDDPREPESEEDDGEGLDGQEEADDRLPIPGMKLDESTGSATIMLTAAGGLSQGAGTKRPAKPKRHAKKMTKKPGKATRKTTRSDRKKSKEAPSRLERELKQVYVDDSGDMPDMSRIERNPWTLRKRILIGLVAFFAFLTALSWVGFFIFNRPATFTGDQVSLQVKAPSTVQSGQSVSYVISYANEESVPLKDGMLEIVFPDEFVYESAEPAPRDADREQEGPRGSDTWDLGSLSRGEKGTVEVSGRLIGLVPSSATLSATLSYEPADFSSEFTEAASATTEIASSVLSAELSGPESPVAGEDVAYEIVVSNASESEVSGARVILALPGGFEVASADPEPDEQADESVTWEIKSIEGSSDSSLEITGSFGIQDSDDGQDLGAGFSARVELDANGASYLQQEVSLEPAVSRSDLSLVLELDGSQDDVTVNFGDTLNYSLIFENEGDVSLGDIELSMDLDSDAIDWSTYSDTVGGEVSSGIVTWDGESLGKLETLDIGEQSAIQFSVQLRPFGDLDEDELDRDLTVRARASALVGRIGEAESRLESQSNEIRAGIDTQVSLLQEVRYFGDSETLGSGPLPPMVGEATNYRVIWQVRNTYAEATDVTVTATLPQGVSFVGEKKVTAGMLSGSADTVTWDIGRLPRKVTIEVQFEISLIPASGQAGDYAVLIESTRLRATDSQTGTMLEPSAGTQTTELLDDEEALLRGGTVEGGDPEVQDPVEPQQEESPGPDDDGAAQDQEQGQAPGAEEPQES